MSAPSQDPLADFGLAVHLLPDASSEAESEPLVVAGGVAGLDVAAEGGTPVLVEAGHDARVVLQQVRVSGKDRLLLAAADGVKVRHNDELAASLVLLTPGDQVALDGGLSFEFALYNRPFVGVPPEEHRDCKCQLCLQPVGEIRSYRCSCGRFYHAELSESGLQCALVGSSNCVGCGAPVRFEPGYLGAPQFLPVPASEGGAHE